MATAEDQASSAYGTAADQQGAGYPPRPAMPPPPTGPLMGRGQPEPEALGTLTEGAEPGPLPPPLPGMEGLAAEQDEERSHLSELSAGDLTRVVALFDFDPSQIQWPYQTQKALPLKSGEVVQLLHDSGGEWIMGHVLDRPEEKGFFPRKYTVPMPEYHELMRPYEAARSPQEASFEHSNADSRRVVAICDWDPSGIPWPSAEHLPLPLQDGQELQILHDEGGDWVVGQVVANPEARGFFPRAYAVSVDEYQEMRHTLQASDLGGRSEFSNARDEAAQGSGGATYGGASSSSSPARGGEAGGSPSSLGGSGRPARPSMPPPAGPAGRGNAPEMSTLGTLREHEEQPSIISSVTTATTIKPSAFELSRSGKFQSVLPEDDIAAARAEVEKELASMEDTMALPTKMHSESRLSTPATELQNRPEKNYVRKHLPMELQNRYLRDVSFLKDVVRLRVKAPWQPKLLYEPEPRTRATNCRMAAEVKPPHMRLALQRSAGSGAQWTQMFRPGFNDILNESYKMGCNTCILSKAYLSDASAKEQFQKLHARDIGGTLWFELQRQETSIFYTRMDFVDVMMRHPEAWSFPDTRNSVSATPGEPIDPFHGWLAQRAINADKEMADVDFCYSIRVRAVPPRTFQALALGKIPDFLQQEPPTEEAEAEAAVPERKAEARPRAQKAIEVTKPLMSQAGLGEAEDRYVTLEEIRKAGDYTAGSADVLDCKAVNLRLKGINAMRIFLRSRGCPDNMKQPLITPKQVKDMAAQLGIRGQPSLYWYALFALRYPLAPDWDCAIRNDTRIYLHLPNDRPQTLHPMIRRFREHLDDCKQNEFLWDNRGFVKMKCSECGIPEAVVWCQQCTDYFCADDFLRCHKSARGKKHWPMPIPGCRYLTPSQAARMSDHIPLLNVGFSHRRRFLAPAGTQSDKNGSRNGDPWLFFDSDTFEAALTQAPEKHWYLKRLKPPRLSPEAPGYFYNFANDVIADDANYILTKAYEQKALALLQKNIRGAVVRRRIRRETQAVMVIQKNKAMWDVQKINGKNGENKLLLRSWYLKFQAKQDNEKLERRMERMQAVWKGFVDRQEFGRMMANTRRFQASFRGLLDRRRHLILLNAAICIQKCYRGHLFARRRLREEHKNARLIQGMTRGVAYREGVRRQGRAAACVQAHYRGLVARKRVRRMRAAGLKIQRNWRRFQAQLDVKCILYDKLETIRLQRVHMIRRKMEECGALYIQRNWRRYRDFQRVVSMRREKSDADRRISTMLVALYIGAAELRHYVHPWWRHLPAEIQEVLQQIKASLQRTIGLVPVSGKLASEELGRRSRANKVEEFDALNREPDLASHMLLSVTRHLLVHVPAEVFASTVQWAAYAIAHQAVSLNAQTGAFPREIVPVGKEMPPHPGDKLSTLYEDCAVVKHHHDWLITLAEESLPCLILHGLPTHHRHVYLTAEVLITMRQALEQPSLSTDDHLKFQGLDASSGAQMMEVLSSELDHRLPYDWPKSYGTVAALAGQLGGHMTKLSSEKGAAGEAKAAERKPQPKEKAKAKAKSKSRAFKKESTEKEVAEKVVEILKLPELPDSGGLCSHFNRPSTLRVLQQVGRFLCEREDLLEAVLAKPGDPGAQAGQGLRKSRYISVTDKLFEMADRAEHDHCSFVLAVVVYHMVLRGLLLRLVYHRASVSVQQRYRYLSGKGKKNSSIAPAIYIQRCWRGLRVRLRIMVQDDAAEQIQRNYRAWRWNKTSRHLLACTLKIQQVWHGAVQRKWLKHCQHAAVVIQRFARGLLVRGSLDRQGRQLARQFQQEMAEVLQQKREMSETEFLARTAAVAGKARVALHKHREKTYALRQMTGYQMKAAHARELDKRKKLAMKGKWQPARLSVFEPMVVALARLDPPRDARYGAQQSRVMMQVTESRKALERSLPQERKVVRFAPSHAAAKRGRAAVAARRLVKKPVRIEPKQVSVNEAQLRHWMALHLAAPR